jgi:ribose-phosphate pyrophosphokinase
MLDVAAQLKQKGAKRIFAFSTFGLFTSGPDKFDKAYKEGIIDKVFTTNLTYTTPDVLSREWHVEVNMCKYVAYIIDTLNHDDTLSELLNPVKRIHKLVEKHKKDQETQVQMKFDN